MWNHRAGICQIDIFFDFFHLRKKTFRKIIFSFWHWDAMPSSWFFLLQNLRTNDKRQYWFLPKFSNLIQGHLSCGNLFVQFTHGSALVDRKYFKNTPSKTKKLELREETFNDSKIITDHILNHSIHLRRHLLIRAAVEIITERSKI